MGLPGVDNDLTIDTVLMDMNEDELQRALRLIQLRLALGFDEFINV